MNDIRLYVYKKNKEFISIQSFNLILMIIIKCIVLYVFRLTKLSITKELNMKN